MSYFENPDGTITFVNDRYDSAGNISGYSQQSSRGIRKGEDYDNRAIYTNIPSKNQPRKKSPHRKITPNPPQTDYIRVRGTLYSIAGINEVDKFFHTLISNNIELNEQDISDILSRIKKKKRKDRLISLYKQHQIKK